MSSVALAADIPIYEPPPALVAPMPLASNWTGFYIGVQGGYAFGGESGDLELDVDGDGDIDDDDDGIFDDDGDGLDGFTIGAKIGYDLQVNRFVIGAVADLNYLDLDTDYEFDDFEEEDAAFTLSEGLDWYATLRARAGFLVTDAVLVYGHGGLAYSNVDFEASFDDGDGTDDDDDFDFNDDENLWGWTIGAGVEAAVLANVMVGLEYAYVDLGNGDWDDDDDEEDVFDFDGTDIDFHTIRASVSYKF